MRLLYPLLFFVFLPSVLRPCSCVEIRTFCETITYNSGTVNPDLIILGEKVSDQQEGMEIRVLEILHGAESNATLTVIRGNGADCGVNTDIFQAGEKLIMALYRDNLKPSSYRLFICGVSYLQVDDGRVKGKIAPGIDDLPYAEFRKLDQCGFQPKIDLPELTVFPNPSQDRIFLSAGEIDRPLTVRVRIRDMLGRQVSGDQSIDLEEKSPREILVDRLAGGIYLLEITAGLERRQMRMVIQK